MSSIRSNKVPFLPGNTFSDVTKTKFHKSHTLDYNNGYAVSNKVGAEPSTEDLAAQLASLQVNNKSELAKLTYGNKLQFLVDTKPAFVPAHVSLDKQVLRFYGFFKQALVDSTEQYHLHRVNIYYFLEDGSISVAEPPVENSGLQQGVLIRRQRISKADGEFFGVRDFNVGINITFFGKTFRIVDCDKFTEKHLTEKESIQLNAREEMPVDPFIVNRLRSQARNNLESLVPNNHGAQSEKMRRFLENDHKVLRFFAVWDDTHNVLGEVRDFELHYYLVDDSIEIREIRAPNCGRDWSPILLKRQQLPKKYEKLDDLNSSIKVARYNWTDLKIGAVVDVLGRKFLIHDCDGFTKQFYSSHGASQSELQPIRLGGARDVKPAAREIPPYNGFGTPEDSMGSCKYLIPKQPHSDFWKMVENENNILRFVAKMESKIKEDQGRRFVISFRCSDDSVTIFETPIRNSGILGGKFLERTRIIRAGSDISDPNPEYLRPSDFYIGAQLEILNHKFTLLDADEFVFGFFQKMNLPVANVDAIKSKLAGVKSNLVQALAANATNGLVSKDVFVGVGKQVAGGIVNEHELVTLFRALKQNGQVNVNAL